MWACRRCFKLCALYKWQTFHAWHDAVPCNRAALHEPYMSPTWENAVSSLITYTLMGSARLLARLKVLARRFCESAHVQWRGAGGCAHMQDEGVGPCGRRALQHRQNRH